MSDEKKIHMGWVEMSNTCFVIKESWNRFEQLSKWISIDSQKLSKFELFKIFKFKKMI
jgi:hypothetical protein